MVQYLIAAMVDFLVGAMALVKGRGCAAKALACMAFSLGVWSLELFLLTIIKDQGALNFWFHLTRVGMFFIPPSFALLCWCLLRPRSKLFFRIVVVPGVITAAALSILNNFFFPSALREVERGYLPDPDVIYYVFAATFLWCLLSSVVYSVSMYAKVSSREKRRLKWLFIVMSITAVLGISSLYFMVFDFYLSKLVGTATNIIVIVSFLYATISRNLMDVHMALSIGLSRAILLATFSWFFFFVSERTVGDVNSLGGMLLALVFFVIVLEGYPVLLKWVQQNAKRLVSSYGYELDELIRSTRRKFISCSSVRDLTEILDNAICKQLMVEGYELYLHEDNDWSRVCPSDPGADSGALPAEVEKVAKLAAGDSAVFMMDEVVDLDHSDLRFGAFGAWVVVAENAKPIAVLLVGRSKVASYYRYDDICFLEWMAKELVLIEQIRAVERFQVDLNDSKKKLSLLGVLNHYHHDIKAPLSIIDGVLSHQLYDADKQRKIILEQVELGSKLITTMANLLNGNRSRQVSLIEMKPVLEDCFPLFHKNMEHSKIHLQDDLFVRGDRDDLKIMFINIIKNAVEAAGPGNTVGVTITLWQDKERVKVSVSDDGEGIDPEKLSRLWEVPFTTKPQGNGIGLQAIKRIADEHHATIDVRSEPGRGTEFVFSFPAAVPATPAGETAGTLPV